MANEIQLTSVVETHLHVRGGKKAELALPHTSYYASYALIMPNVPRLLTGQNAVDNADSLKRIIEKNEHECEIIPCIMLDQKFTTPAVIEEAARLGVRHAKMYPIGATTGSDEYGVHDLPAMKDTLLAMQDEGMFLHLHGELPPPHFVLDREAGFIPTLDWLNDSVADLDVALEHVVDAKAIKAIEDLPDNFFATQTGHHLYDDLNIVIGGMLDPHAFCKPVHKRPEDRLAGIRAATSGSKKFCLGTDSAPHGIEKKECAHGCAGAFTAPIALPMLAEVFEEHLPAELVQTRLQNFTSNVALDRFGLEPRTKTVRLVRRPHKVAASFTLDEEIFIPYRANHTFTWSIAGID